MSPIERRFSLAGRTAIVTGVGAGIGAHVATVFAEAGARVVCAARSAQVIEHTVAGIRERGGEALAVRTDVANGGDLVALVDAARSAFGPIHIVFNNATAGAIPAGTGVWDNTAEVWNAALTANITAIFELTRLVYPDMESHGRGSIITVGSSAGFSVPGRSIAYGVAKAGTAMLTRYLAKALAPAARVNMVSVGTITPDGNEADKLKAYASMNLTARNALQRFGRADEVASAALYLASDASSYTTGSTVFVEGGRIGTLG